MNIINLTGAAVRILRCPNTDDKSVLMFPPYVDNGKLVTCDATQSNVQLGFFDNVPVETVNITPVLPQQLDNTLFIVPEYVAAACPWRNDLIFPKDIAIPSKQENGLDVYRTFQRYNIVT